jgi:hypothetical protein
MRITAIAVCLMLLAGPGVGLGAPADREIVVEVTSIAAAMRAESDGAVELDPRLAPLSRKLRALFAYQRYTFLESARMSADFGGACPFQLPEHFTLEVIPERFERGGSGMIAMVVTLFREVPNHSRGRGRGQPEREVILRTQIRLKNGGTVLLGGPPIRGGVLLMALSAHRS